MQWLLVMQRWGSVMQLHALADLQSSCPNLGVLATYFLLLNLTTDDVKQTMVVAIYFENVPFFYTVLGLDHTSSPHISEYCLRIPVFRQDFWLINLTICFLIFFI